MHLTAEEQKMLDGAYGETVRRSMKVLVALGEIYGADHMIEVKNVHSPGVSYRVAGDAGLGYVEDASKDAVFQVPMTLNTIGIDEKDWKQIGFPEDFSCKQLELSRAYEKMGAIPTNSCTPYLNGNLPMFGEHVAWGESSAVAFVNSVIGARTNREGGPTALAAAITGRVPAYGYHLDENRKGTHLIRVEVDLKTDKDFAVLGYFGGKLAGKDVPVFEGIKRRPTLEQFKALGAALASAGAVALYHVVGFTPEAPTKQDVIGDEIQPVVFDQAAYDKVCTSRMVRELAERMGFVEDIQAAGGEIICDTCPVLCCTLTQRGYKTVATNSGKMAHYAPGLWNLQPVLLNTAECIQAAIDGKWGE